MTCSDSQSFWVKLWYQLPASRRSAATDLHRWEELNVSTAVIIYADTININTLLGGATLSVRGLLLSCLMAEKQPSQLASPISPIQTIQSARASTCGAAESTSGSVAPVARRPMGRCSSAAF